MRLRRSSAVASASMPPALSDPSLSSTRAPMGSVAASAATCFSPSARCVAGSAAVSLRGDSRRSARAPRRYSRTWNREPSSWNARDSSKSIARSRRLRPPSATAMLRESSTTTATTFCCVFSDETLMAGCHKSKSSSASRALWSAQIAADRRPSRPPRRLHNRYAHSTRQRGGRSATASTPAACQEEPIALWRRPPADT